MTYVTPRRFVAGAAALAIALGLLVRVAAPASAAAWTPRPATFRTAVERDVRITMSDGIRLTADVVRPAGKDGKAVPGRFPVLLSQTPYNKNGITFRSDYLVSRGYVQVIVEVRGTGSSEGVWDSFGTREQLDGKELVEWAGSKARPWSDGRVGLHGTSYGAINQLFTAAQQPKGLKAAFPIVPVADIYRDIVASGGQVNTSFIPAWLALVTALGLVPGSTAATDPVAAAGSVASHAAGVAAFQLPMATNASSGGDAAFDGPFYRLRSPIEVVDRIKVPTFLVGGWFDLFQRGVPMLFQRLQANNVPTGLVMGPWYHVTVGTGLPADGVPMLDEQELRWMDRWLQGRPDATISQRPAVTYYNNGVGHYRTAPSWPPPAVKYSSRYLAAGGKLAAGPPSKQAPDILPWQPASGACSRSTTQWTAGAAVGPCETDNRATDAGGLTYDLPVPAKGLSLAGPIAARLFVSSNGHDSFLTARVEDVAPDGKATQLTAGWNVLSLRALDPLKSTVTNGLVVAPFHPYTKASALAVAPGTVNEVWVEIFGTAARLAKGHRLRLSIQPSDAPHLSAPAPQALASAGGVLSIYHDAAHPSAVVLPLAEG